MVAVKLSIIIPVYNVALWLPQTVKSVLEQTEADFELILVDDGATDGSGELCDAFALADSRVRVIHQENQGVSAARNAGLEAAQGEFIGWVDSDDIIEKDMFAVMLALAERHDADIVQCEHDRLDLLNGAARTGDVEIMDGPTYVRRIFTKQGGRYTNQVALWSKIYKKELFSNIRFPVGRVYEDEQQTYKICLKAAKIVETQDTLYHYIKRENSIITGETPKKMLDKQQALLDRLHYLPERLPDLKENCARSFVGFSERILCQLYERGESTAVERGMEVLISQRKVLKPYLNQYEKLYFPLLGIATGWILGNEFMPIQKVMVKIKGLFGGTK